MGRAGRFNSSEMLAWAPPSWQTDMDGVGQASLGAAR